MTINNHTGMLGCQVVTLFFACHELLPDMSHTALAREHKTHGCIDVHVLHVRQAGKVPIKHEIVDMSKVVDHVVATLGPTVRHGVALEKAYASKLPPLVADGARLIQVGVGCECFELDLFCCCRCCCACSYWGCWTIQHHHWHEGMLILRLSALGG